MAYAFFVVQVTYELTPPVCKWLNTEKKFGKFLMYIDMV